MRVPEISATAGYAATQSLTYNRNEANTSFLFLATELEHNKNGNLRAANSSNASFTSSAADFVQKALSYSPTEYTADQELTRGAEDQVIDHFMRGHDNGHAEKKTNLTECYAIEGNRSNTYRSFKEEVYNINRNSFEELDKVFEGTKISESLSTHNSGPKANQVRSTNALEDSFSNSVCSYKLCISPSVLDRKNNLEPPKRLQTSSVALYKDEYSDNEADLVNENGYEDQLMIDFCNKNTKSSLDNDDRDDYLTSPASSVTSQCNPRHLYFPRGIINPNYPGFQHLAHTLSEHFVESITADSNDSDMSECEMELSADSFDELPEEGEREEINTEINYNNNNNTFTISNEPEFGNRPSAQSDEHRSTRFGELPMISDPNSNISKAAIDMQNLPNNLETALILLESPTRKNQNTELENFDANLISNEKLNSMIEKFDCTTPDILKKNCSHRLTETPFKKENCPDLLRGVSPRPKLMCKPDSGFDFGPKQVESSKAGKIAFNSCAIQNVDSTKDEMLLGVTPVDIIGDFGQEVEREFGLLVSGYRRLVDVSASAEDDCMGFPIDQTEKVADAMLSGVSDKIDSSKLLSAYKLLKEASTDCVEDTEDNAVDWSRSISIQESDAKTRNKSIEDNDENKRFFGAQKTKYSSYDDRQLPPVAIDYKRCQQSLRTSRKPSQSSGNCSKGAITKVSRTHSNTSLTNRTLHTKRSNNGGTLSSYRGNRPESSASRRKREEAEINQYQQLISDKELILSNSKYANTSSWAKYVKGSVKDRSFHGTSDLLSPSALDLFNAYKIGKEIDVKTLEKHLQLAKEIEKKRRNDREEIHRRLAMDAEEQSNDQRERQLWKPNLQMNKRNGATISHISEISSDNESHSSDSETCPKLSKTKPSSNVDFLGAASVEKFAHPYNGRSPSVSFSDINSQSEKLQQQSNGQRAPFPNSDEDDDCDFFTKQARLQIEARMALAQAKEMAHMQMEIDRQNQLVSPITALIRGSLEKVGVQMNVDKRRVCRQMLTEMNIAQLQVLVNSLHTHIEELNESLVHFLMERDDLHLGQDSMLVDIEELTRFIGAKERLAQQDRKSAIGNRSE